MIRDRFFKPTFKKLKLFYLFLIVTTLTLIISPILAQESPQDREFISLENKLIDYGFTVKLEIPPYRDRRGLSSYGQIDTTQTVWINPIVFELGIAKSTLVHEATHAAQLCVGDRKEFKPLNLDIEPPKMVHPHFMRYHNYRKEVEAEAYTVQVQPNKLELVDRLLASHCAIADN